MVNTQFGKGVKKIWTDNGGEFASNQMVKYYEYTRPYRMGLLRENIGIYWK